MPNRSKPRLRVALLFTIPLLLAHLAPAQPPQKGPAAAIALAMTLAPYDVISIKQNKSGDSTWKFNFDNDTFIAHNVPVKFIIADAYAIKGDLIAGLAGPVASANFDITAKILPSATGALPTLTGEQMGAMLIPMLADRFHLKAHLETKMVPVYDLVLAKGGLKLKLDRSAGTDSTAGTNREGATEAITATNASMAGLAAILSNEIHREVVDKTNLPGHASFTLKWTDELAADQNTPNAISIFTAIQDQLGLKLQPSKGPVDTLVIDHVEMPTEN